MSKLTTRQERFCKRFVECANAAGAARAAGYTPRSARSTGYRLLREPAVVKRITDLQVDTARAHCAGVELLLGKLEALFRQSFEDHQYSTAARVVELQARLAGLSAGGTNGARRRLEPATAGKDNDSSASHSP